MISVRIFGNTKSIVVVTGAPVIFFSNLYGALFESANACSCETHAESAQMSSFFVNAAAASPEPRLMHKRTVRRIHQPDDSMIHAATAARTERCAILKSRAEFRQFRRRHVPDDLAGDCVPGAVGNDKPRRSRRFLRTDNASAKIRSISICLARQRRNLRALPAAPIKLPAVIAALHIVPIKASIRERNAAVRTRIAHGKRVSLRDLARAPAEFRAASP